MDARTLRALKGSIRKWQRIVAGTGADRGTDNCPLCAEFLVGLKCCVGCPVREATALPGCVGTPYQKWGQLFGHAYPFRATSKKKIAAAKAELKFLQSLLPKDTAP